jgi:hypothetical protein
MGRMRAQCPRATFVKGPSSVEVSASQPPTALAVWFPLLVRHIVLLGLVSRESDVVDYSVSGCSRCMRDNLMWPGTKSYHMAYHYCKLCYYYCYLVPGERCSPAGNKLKNCSLVGSVWVKSCGFGMRWPGQIRDYIRGRWLRHCHRRCVGHPCNLASFKCKSMGSRKRLCQCGMTR